MIVAAAFVVAAAGFVAAEAAAAADFRQPSHHANGLVFDAQWRLLACEGGDPSAGTPPRVTRTDLKTGRTEVLADSCEGKRFRAPNDIKLDGRGRVYFTDKTAFKARTEFEGTRR